ncbi:MAG TPA: hypothetical protein VLB79_12380 [Solirubrobacterales bacterium]|nr:hypothetical protein [Solirubrobacterales bacterium]
MSGRKFSRRRQPDPEARPRGRRSAWAPFSVASAETEDRDIEPEVTELVAVLREQGPMNRRELRRAVEGRFWGPGRFGDALWLARRRGLVRRDGNRLTAADGGQGGGRTDPGRPS